LANKNPRQSACRGTRIIDGVFSGISTPRDMWVPETKCYPCLFSFILFEKLSQDLIAKIIISDITGNC
jgi:hypothetical protein